MKCTKITSFRLVVVTHAIFLAFFSSENFKVDAATFGLGMFNNYNYNNRKVNSADNFFDLISRVPISIFDVAAMYQNISGTAYTKKCHVCRTPVALWVLNSLITCHDITKEDCPIGLVCCHPAQETLIVDNTVSLNDSKRSASNVVQVTAEADEWNEDEFDPSSFRQDPIPGDPDSY